MGKIEMSAIEDCAKRSRAEFLDRLDKARVSPDKNAFDWTNGAFKDLAGLEALAGKTVSHMVMKCAGSLEKEVLSDPEVMSCPVDVSHPVDEISPWDAAWQATQKVVMRRVLPFVHEFYHAQYENCTLDDLLQVLDDAVLVAKGRLGQMQDPERYRSDVARAEELLGELSERGWDRSLALDLGSCVFPLQSVLSHHSRPDLKKRGDQAVEIGGYIADHGEKLERGVTLSR